MHYTAGVLNKRDHVDSTCTSSEHVLHRCWLTVDCRRSLSLLSLGVWTPTKYFSTTLQIAFTTIARSMNATNSSSTTHSASQYYRKDNLWRRREPKRASDWESKESNHSRSWHQARAPTGITPQVPRWSARHVYSVQPAPSTSGQQRRVTVAELVDPLLLVAHYHVHVLMITSTHSHYPYTCLLGRIN